MLEKFPIEGAKACPSGSGTVFGYKVEARMNYHDPAVICGNNLDNRWRPIRVYDGPGVTHRVNHHLAQVGLFEYETAEALRWQFISAARAEELGSLCLETRLVKCKVEYSYSATPIAYVAPMDGRGGVPKDMQPEAAP